MTVRHVAALLAALASLTACATPTGFYWGGYDQALYQYSRKPEAREAYAKALQAAIDQGRLQNRLAPGLQAELGFVRLEQGDAQAAIALFRAEAQSFPESTRFMNRVIESLSRPEAAATPTG
jgi:hypothetical protein